jgi:hypothetical protein
MATLHDTREPEALWEQLMAELHALDERVNYAVRPRSRRRPAYTLLAYSSSRWTEGRRGYVD